MNEIQKKLHDAFLKITPLEVTGAKGVGTLSTEEAVAYYGNSYRTRVSESMDDRYKVLSKVCDKYSELRDDFITGNPSTFFALDDYGLGFSKWLLDQDILSYFVELAILEESLDLFTRIEVKENTDFDFSTLDPTKKLYLTHGELIPFKTSTFSLWEVEKIIENIRIPEKVFIFYRDEEVIVKNLEHWQFNLLSEFSAGITLEEAMSYISTDDVDPKDLQEFFTFLSATHLLIQD